jgi:hypothetical protein
VGGGLIDDMVGDEEVVTGGSKVPCGPDGRDEDRGSGIDGRVALEEEGVGW